MDPQDPRNYFYRYRGIRKYYYLASSGKSVPKANMPKDILPYILPEFTGSRKADLIRRRRDLAREIHALLRQLQEVEREIDDNNSAVINLMEFHEVVNPSFL